MVGNNLQYTLGTLFLINWFCGASLLPCFAQSIDHPSQEMTKAMPALIQRIEQTPDSFPISLAPQLTRLVQNKEWSQIESLLDAYTLLEVQINPETRVKLRRGNAKRHLVVGRKRLFLVKVLNEAGSTAPLQVTSPQKGQSDWLNLTFKGIYAQRENATLSGKPREFCVLELCSQVQGIREALFSADLGQGTQDTGFRGEVSLLLHCSPAEQTQKAQHVRGKSRMVPGIK